MRVVGGAGGAGGRAGAAMEHYSSSLSFGGASLFVKKEDVWAGAVGAVGAVWGVWVAGRERCGSAGWAVSVGCRAGAASCLLSGEYGSMWAVGAVGVFGAVWVVLRVAGRERCGRAWGGVGVGRVGGGR